VIRCSHQMTTVSEQIVHSCVKPQETLRPMPRSESPKLSFALPVRLVREFGLIIRILTCVVYLFRHNFADGGENFVDMPGVAELAFSALEPSAETGAELQTTAANPLVRYPNTPHGKEVFDISEAKGKTMVEPHSPSNDVGRKAVSTVVAGIIHADIVENCRQVDKNRHESGNGSPNRPQSFQYHGSRSYQCETSRSFSRPASLRAKNWIESGLRSGKTTARR